MRREIMFLKIATFVMAIPAIAASIIIVMLSYFTGLLGHNLSSVKYSSIVMIVLFISMTIPYYLALIQSYRLLNLIDNKEIFSAKAIAGLEKIIKLTKIDSLLAILNIPFILIILNSEAIYGLIIINCFILFGCLTVQMFTIVLINFFKKGIDNNIK